MKKTILALFFIGLFSANLVAQTKPEITIKIKGANRSYALLAYYYGDRQYIADSAKMAPDGTVIFNADSAYQPGTYFVVYNQKSDFFEFFIEDNNQRFTIETIAEEPVAKAKIKNSPGNKLFFEYLIFIDNKKEEGNSYQLKQDQFKAGYPDSATVYQLKLEKLDKEVKAYQEKVMKEQPASYLALMLKGNWTPDVPKAPKGVEDTARYVFYEYRSHYWDRFPFLDPRIVNTPILHSKITDYLEKMTPVVPDSVIASIRFICDKLRPNPRAYKYAVIQCINRYAKDKTVGFDAVYVFMVNEYYVKNKAPWVSPETLDKMTKRADVLAPLLLGKIPPALNLPDTNGLKHSLLDIESAYTIVFFWSPDCGHCLEDAPKLAEFYRKAKSKGIEVYAVACDAKDEQWKTAIQSKGLNWINVIDTENQHHAYDVPTFPVVYILDKDKKIVMKRIEVDQVQWFFEQQYKMAF